jgi:hypothetical protein
VGLSGRLCGGIEAGGFFAEKSILGVLEIET